MKHSLLDRSLLFSGAFLCYSGNPDVPFGTLRGVNCVGIGHGGVFGFPAAIGENASGYLLFLCLAAGVVVLLATSLLIVIRRVVRQHRQITSYRHHHADQLRFIRKLLDLCYSYRESPLVFLDKFKDSVNFRQLKSYDLIESSDKRLSELKEDERMLCLLFNRGFTPRELCVIFDLKKINNLYVKYHRIRKKLGDE